MPRFMVSIFHPEGYDPFVSEDAAMDQAIDDLNDAMTSAGVRVFVGGLQPEGRARSIHGFPGQLVVNDGPHRHMPDHVGGFWVLEVEDMDAAIEWGRQAAVACRTPVEVRPFF